jgi:phosphoglucosamine mutase
MQSQVIAHGADIGIALDGDADRLIVADENGALIDGDQIMALIAGRMVDGGRLQGGGVVATVMSNLGLEQWMNGRGLDLVRTQVGDRYVVEHMRRNGFNLGGEQSGHIVLGDHATTGDGLIAGLQVVAALIDSDRPASETCRAFEPLPQLLRNIAFNGGTPLDASSVKAAIAEGKNRLGDSGRLLIRKSGTEPLIRVMVEGQDEELIAGIAGEISAAIEQAVAS